MTRLATSTLARLARLARLASLALVVTLAAPKALADPDSAVSLPSQLRPVTIGNSVRLDSAVAAFNDSNGNLDLALASTWTGSYQLSTTWAPLVRLGVVGNNAPGAALDGRAFANPVVGVTHARRRGNYRLALLGAATLPLGTGHARTHVAAMTARPADRAMFDVESIAVIAGVDVAYGHRGFTAQGEATLVQSVRVRGDAMTTEGSPTRGSVGLHLGYLLGGRVAVGSDLHYAATLTASVGVRLQLRLGQRTWLRPGIAYLKGLDAGWRDAPFITSRTTAVQIDVPVTF